jgi:serine/threonine protein phosphatase PrpC
VYKARQSIPTPVGALRLEYAETSLIGGRQDNQDRCALVVTPRSALLVVVDGMGGHAAGALAAATACDSLVGAFWKAPRPLFDPLGFLHRQLGEAHDAVTRLGEAMPLEQRPRATIAACVVQGDSAYWSHVGDSRIYHIRRRAILERTRDHSHVEFLIREGVISADQALTHPMRNYVECCLGGEQVLPEMSQSGRRRLEPGDVLLLCSDGLWGPLDDAALAQAWSQSGEPLDLALAALAERAIEAAGPLADNTTGVVLRWSGRD